MKKLTVTTLKKSLSVKNKQDLILEIAELYKKFPSVKEYYQDELIYDSIKYFGTVRITWYVSIDKSIYIDSFSIAEIPFSIK